jgi:hypothetical protein
VGDKPLDGRDLTSLLMKQATEWPDRTIFSTWAGKVSARTQTHRLDADGNLYDMVKDPGQRMPVNVLQPGLAESLKHQVLDWQKEMFGKVDPKLFAKGKKKSGGGANAVDARPLTVGYKEFPITLLPARDGEPRGGVKRSSNAPNCSYFVNWKTKDDSMVWLLDVHTAGRYEVSIDYTCPIADAGSTIELAFQDSRLSGKVEPGWDPPLYTNQDTLPRPDGESQMKDFRTLKLGEMHLKAGVAPLTLRATDIPGSSVMDVRRITLTLLN